MQSIQDRSRIASVSRGGDTGGMLGAKQGSLDRGSQAESWRWSCISQTLLAGSGWLKPPLPLEVLTLGKAPPPRAADALHCSDYCKKAVAGAQGTSKDHLGPQGKRGSPCRGSACTHPGSRCSANFSHRPAKTVHPRGEAARTQPSYSIPGGLLGSSWQGQPRACAVACGMWAEDSG